MNKYNFLENNYSNNNIISSNYKTYNNINKYKTINNYNYENLLYDKMFQTKKKAYINRNNYSTLSKKTKVKIYIKHCNLQIIIKI